jgi:hypothetical protein
MTNSHSVSRPQRTRRRLFAVGGGVLAVGLIATAYWHWAAGQVVSGLENWRQQQLARGIVVDYGTLDVTGYPFTLDLSLSSPALAAPDGRYWQGPPMTGRAALWDPFTVDADISGLHRFGGLKTIGQMTGLAQQASLQLHFSFNGTLDHAATSMRGIRLMSKDVQLLGIEKLDAVVGPLRPAEANRLQELDFDASASRITLPDDEGTPLGSLVEAISLKATLRGPLPAKGARQALPIWRDAGGEAVVHSARITWGPLMLHAQGGATLDAFLRPEGQFGTRITGLPEILNALVEDGRIKPAQAGLLSFALLSLGGGNAAQIALPISMKNGLLSAGPVPLASIRPVL